MNETLKHKLVEIFSLFGFLLLLFLIHITITLVRKMNLAVFSSGRGLLGCIVALHIYMQSATLNVSQ